MQRTLYAAILKITVGKQCILMRADVVRDEILAFGMVQCQLFAVDFDCEGFVLGYLAGGGYFHPVHKFPMLRILTDMVSILLIFLSEILGFSLRRNMKRYREDSSRYAELPL